MKKITHSWRRSSCFFLLLLAFSGAAKAAPAVALANAAVKPVAWTLTGRVTAATGDPLPGVTVLLKGTTTGTTTGTDGSYSLTVPETAGVLVVSFIGYTTQEKAFSGPGTINFSLADDAKALEEVVVV